MGLGAATTLALLFASALRVNAFFACSPLALAAMPVQLTRTPLRIALAAALTATVFGLMPVMTAKALGAEDTDAKLSLIIFDLGGITEHSQINQFPDLNVADPVVVNRRCYDPSQWDGYSSWAKKPCPLGFDAFQRLVDEGDVDVRMVWLRAIAAHPVAYFEHRLSHFNVSTWFLVPKGPDFTAWTQSAPNPWNFQVQPNPLLNAVNGATNGAAKTPLGWPIFWIAVAFAVAVGGFLAGLDRTVILVATSAFAYGAGYLVVGVATGMRYHMWTISGAAIAAVLASSELSRRISQRDFAVATTPIVIIPTVLAALSRLVL